MHAVDNRDDVKPAPPAPPPVDPHMAQLQQYGRAKTFAKGKASSKGSSKRPSKRVGLAPAIEDEESGLFTADLGASRAASRAEFTPSTVHSRNTVL